VEAKNLMQTNNLMQTGRNFVKCSHLNLTHFLCLQHCSALLVIRARTFIICRPTKLPLVLCPFASFKR